VIAFLEGEVVEKTATHVVLAVAAIPASNTSMRRPSASARNASSR